jgi:toxin ParE1/3/4
MAAFRFSRRAESDLREIARYTLDTWGEKQTIHYIDNLEGCCERLARSPELGRTCDDIRPGLRRLEGGRHVISYRATSTGVIVSRILHQRMLPGKQDMEDTTS